MPVLLHAISSLPTEALGKASELVLAGVAACIEQPGPLRNEMMTSPDFWSILKTLARHPPSAASAFSILERGTTGSPPAIMAENYEAAVSLLNAFATAAHVPAPTEQNADGGQRRADQPKKKVKA